MSATARASAGGRGVPALSVRVSAVEFATAVWNVLPFAGTDPVLPMLGVVRFETTEGAAGVDVVATDQYRLGWHHIPSADAGPAAGGLGAGARDGQPPCRQATAGVSLDAGQLRRVLPLFGFCRRRSLSRRAVAAAGWRVSLAGPAAAGGPARLGLCDSIGGPVVAVELSTPDGWFPDWRRLFADLQPGPPTAELAVSPALLADFAKVANPGGAPMRLSFHQPGRGAGRVAAAGGNWPVRLDTDCFSALLMPCRLRHTAEASVA